MQKGGLSYYELQNCVEVKVMNNKDDGRIIIKRELTIKDLEKPNVWLGNKDTEGGKSDVRNK